jgi:hypothetical protein
MLTSIGLSAAAGWIGRRVQELGALSSIFVPLAGSPGICGLSFSPTVRPPGRRM